MRYPTVNRATLIEVAARFLETGPVPLRAEVTWEGHGPELDIWPLDEMAAACESEIVDGVDLDTVEGAASVVLHRAVSRLPLAVLDDPAFWRYLTLAHGWNFVVWRQRASFESRDPNRYLKYIDAVHPTECVLLRMFLRAQIGSLHGDYALVGAVPAATDLWRSHILRVATGAAPPIARALLREQAEHRMPTDELRSFARRLNRISTNVVLALYDEDDAAELITGLRAPNGGGR